MAKTFSLRGMLVPSQGRKTSSQGGGMPGGGAVAIGTPQQSASTVINNINNVTNVIGGDYSKITRIAIADLLLLDKTQVGEKDLYIVYASGSDAEGWSEEDFEFDGNTYPAESFFQLINGEWQPITDEIDLSKSPKFVNLPEEVYMVEGLFPPTSFPNIYGRDKAGLRIAKVRRYRLDDAGVYQPVKESTGTPGGGTSVNDTWTINVPYARSYVQGGTTHYEGGLLTAEDYQRLKENNGVMIDTEAPEQPSDTHVPSTKLMVDNFKVVNLWLNSLSDTKVNETELSNYFDKNYILANYYDKSLLDEAFSRVQYENTLEENVSALGFTKNAGTITGVVFNGSTLGNSGVIRISAMPLGYFYTSSNNGVVQTGKWREIAYANVNVNAVISVEQNFSISRTIGTSSRGRGIVSVSARVSYGTVSHMSLVTDNNAIVPHVKLKYESGKLSIYVTADDAWDSWRLTSIHYPQYFSPGSDVLVDASVAPAGGMLVSAISYVPDVYNQTYAGAVDWGTAANREKAVTINTLSYWDGSYNGQNHASNLAYCRHGGFGTIVTKDATDYEPIKPAWAAYTDASEAGGYITFLKIKGVVANLIAYREYQFTVRLIGRHASFGGDCTIRIKGTVASATSIGSISLWCTSGEISIPGIRLYKVSDTVFELAVLKTNKYAYAVAKIEESYAEGNCVELEKITNGTLRATTESYYTNIVIPQADWNETDSNKAGYVKNKPELYERLTLGPVEYITESNRKKAVNVNALAFWNGAYNDAGTSNLTFCNRGAFGTIVTKQASDYAVSQALANSSNLDSVTTTGFYYAGGGNACVNVPAINNGNAFGLQVVHSAAGSYYTQIYYDYYGSVFKRFCKNGVWSDWVDFSTPGAQADWNVTNANSPAFIKNKPSAVTKETVSSWGFVKRKFVRRTITYSGGTYGGTVLDSEGVDRCTVYNGRSLAVAVTGITTQQECQDFLLKNTVIVCYTYFDNGVATQSDGIVDKISASGSQINITLKESMLHLTDALVYISVVFDQII